MVIYIQAFKIINKRVLNQKVAQTAEAYIQLYQLSEQPSKEQRLKILSEGIHQIDPDSLGTDDRESCRYI
jgi:hypothetical protein